MTLYISYPDIPANSITITPSVTSDVDQNAWNLVTGERYLRTRAGASGTALDYVFDLGSNYANKQATVDHLIISHASLLKNVPITSWTLSSSPDNSAWTSRISVNPVSGVTLYGPDGFDAISTISVTSAFRYWKLALASAGSTVFQMGKVYFGALFSFSTHPQYKIERIPLSDSTWYADSGSKYFARALAPVYRFTLNWVGVSDEEVESFQSKVTSQSRLAGYFLYTDATHEILDNQRLVHCRLIDAQCRQIGNTPDYNEVSAVFEEMLG